MNNKRTAWAYGEWMHRLEMEGFKPFFLTFMFDQVSGSALSVQREMERVVETVYARSLTRLLRYPHSVANRGRKPVWVMCPDYPVPKGGKSSLRDVVVNDGRHVQGTAMIPPNTRLRDRFDLHLLANSDLYVQWPLSRLDATPIRSRLSYVSGDYGLKSVLRGRVGWDELLILPRTQSEMPSRLDRQLLRDGAL